jgi:fatty acid desaturase
LFFALILTRSNCQPTHSLYSPFASLVMFSENYHVEHHDFPEFPLHLLGRVFIVLLPSNFFVAILRLG